MKSGCGIYDDMEMGGVIMVIVTACGQIWCLSTGRLNLVTGKWGHYGDWDVDGSVL